MMKIKESNVTRFKLCNSHEKYFPDDKPRSYWYILLKITNLWDTHPLRPELTTLYQRLSLEEQKQFKEEFIEEVELNDKMIGIAPAFHFEKGVHKSWKLIEYLPRDKEIKFPLCIWYNFKNKKEKWYYGYVHEGHHRAGAAKLLGWKSVPALKVAAIDRQLGYGGMTYEDRQDLKVELEKRNLPDTSRIYGTKIVGWTKEEIEQFMVPRPKSLGKYNMRNLSTKESIGKDKRWEGIPFIPVGVVK